MFNTLDFSESNTVLKKTCIDNTICGVVLRYIRSRALCSFTLRCGTVGERPTLTTLPHSGLQSVRLKYNYRFTLTVFSKTYRIVWVGTDL